MSKSTVDINPLDNVVFEKLTFILPSGLELTIRETSGEDDDILSKRDQTLEHVNKYLSNIVVEPKMSANDIKKLKVRDKYFLLLKSRIFSLGPELTWEHTFQDGSKSTIEEDLNIFTHDYSEPWVPGSKAPMPYLNSGDSIELELSSGKICKYEYLTGLHEKKLLDNKQISLQNLSVNTMLTVRNFAIQDNGNWTLLQRFNMFKSREMREIRKHLEQNDPEWGALMEVPHPYGGPTEFVSAFQVEDFFFPAG